MQRLNYSMPKYSQHRSSEPVALIPSSPRPQARDPKAAMYSPIDRFGGGGQSSSMTVARTEPDDVIDGAIFPSISWIYID